MCRFDCHACHRQGGTRHGPHASCGASATSFIVSFSLLTMSLDLYASLTEFWFSPTPGIPLDVLDFYKTHPQLSILLGQR